MFLTPLNRPKDHCFIISRSIFNSTLHCYHAYIFNNINCLSYKRFYRSCFQNTINHILRPLPFLWKLNRTKKKKGSQTRKLIKIINNKLINFEKEYFNTLSTHFVENKSPFWLVFVLIWHFTSISSNFTSISPNFTSIYSFHLHWDNAPTELSV